MGEIGDGYGSEWHLLRYLGYHRNRLFNQIEALTGGRVIDWLDHHFDRGRYDRECKTCDREWKGMEFLGTDHPAFVEWPAFWPQTGNVHNWDGVALHDHNARIEWLLVEAKAHVWELASDCGAKEAGGLSVIRTALTETMRACRSTAASVDQWLCGYYQRANRLAALHFLIKHGVPARLLNIYFVGDRNPNRQCPTTVEEWQSAIAKMEQHLGIGANSPLHHLTHTFFLHVCPTEDRTEGFTE